MRRTSFAWLALGVLAGCESQPSASVTSVRMAHLSPSKVGIDTNIKVTNPLAVPIPLLDLHHRLDADGRRLLVVSTEDPPWAVPAHSQMTVSARGDLRFQNILAVIGDHYSSGTRVPYRTTTDLSWRSPVGTLVAFPTLTAAGDFPIPRLPQVTLRSLPELHLDFGSLDNPFTPDDEQQAGSLSGTVHLRLKNQNQYAVRFTRLSASLEARDPFHDTNWLRLAEIGASGSRPIASSGTQNLDVDFRAPLPSLEQAVLLAIQAITEISKFRVRGSVVLKIQDIPVEVASSEDRTGGDSPIPATPRARLKPARWEPEERKRPRSASEGTSSLARRTDLTGSRIFASCVKSGPPARAGLLDQRIYQCSPKMQALGASSSILST